MSKKGIILTLLSATLFGLTPILAKQITLSGVSAETLIFYRNLFAIPFLFLLCLKDKCSFKVTKRELIQIFLIALFGQMVTTVALYGSYAYINVGTATTLHFLYPLFVALICRIVFKDKMSKLKTMALVVATAGVMFFIEPGNEGFIGILLAIFSGFTFALYFVGVEKCGLNHKNPYLLSLYFAIFVALDMLVYNLVMNKMTFDISLENYGLMALVAIGTSFLGIAFLQMGIKYLGATMAAIFCMFEPISSIIGGMIFLNEGLTLAKLIGCIVILGAVSAIVVEDYLKNKQEK